MILSALLLCILSASALLGWGAFTLGQTPVMAAVWIFGSLWMILAWRRQEWVSSLALILYTGLSAFGVWLDADTALAAAVCALTLAAWDLTNFHRRAQLIAADDDRRGLEIRHILQVSLLMLAGWILALVSVNLKIKLTFEWVAALIVVILFGLGQLVRWLRR